MHLKITRAVKKACEKFDAKQYRQVVSAILALLDNPEPHDSQQMRGAKRGERRVDVGEYRIIYVVDGEVVEILIVGKRNDDDVYKQFDRMK